MKAGERRQLLSGNSMNSSTQSLESQEVEAIVSGSLNGTGHSIQPSSLTVSSNRYCVLDMSMCLCVI